MNSSAKISDRIEAEDIYRICGSTLTITGAILWPAAGIAYFLKPVLLGDLLFIGTLMMMFGIFLLMGAVLMRQV